MEEIRSVVTTDSQGSKTLSSRGLEGQNGRSLDTESQDSVKSYTFFRRSRPGDLGEDEEESEGTVGEQDLKGTYKQLVQGVQEWQDGCVYKGEFGLNMKLGYGEFSWPTGEAYHGQFYRDHFHGLGTYTWPDGSSFTGTFYLSQREGYGTMHTKTMLFQGLYKEDQRFGPGIETYPDGSQDVGLWFREYLLKLCTRVPSGFSLVNYPEFLAFLTKSRRRLDLSDEKVELGLSEEQDPFFYDYKQYLLNDELKLPPEMHVYSTDNSHLPMTDSLRQELDDHIFMNEIPPFIEDEEPWLITNETPLLVKIQKQTYKFRNKDAHTSWNIPAILEGNRSRFGPSGPKEQISKKMIMKAEEGDYNWIFGILRDNLACADVADSKGYTVLAAAAMHSHLDIVNLLLDFGADVNKRSDEGITPLSMCFLQYYPCKSFHPNIAERTLLQESPKSLVTPKISFLLADANIDYLYDVGMPIAGGDELKTSSLDDSLASMQTPESSNMLHKEEVSPVKTVSTDVEKESEGAAENVDASTLYSVDTNFESTKCLRNYTINVSRDIMEKSAQAYSSLPQHPCFPYKGTVRKMAQSMVERRNRWMTITLLLRRGADPNLCQVPMQALFLAVKAGDVEGVRLLLMSGAQTDIQFPPQLQSLTPLHIAVSLPGEEGVKITELLLHVITNVDAKAADEDYVYKGGKADLLPSSLKLNNEPGPPKSFYSTHTFIPEEGGRTALHVACEREDNKKCARDIVRLLLSHRANPNVLWSGHSPLSLAIASGNDLVVKELLSQGADPNLPLTKGLGTALCVVCDLVYEQQRSVENKIALIDRLISYGADVLNPVTLVQGDRTAVGTAVDYGYFKFFQDRKIAHCPFHALMPAEREVFMARKRLLEYLGLQLRLAVLSKESRLDTKALYLSKRAELAPCHRLKKKGSSSVRTQSSEKQSIPFYKFCYQCGRSIGVRLSPCPRCYGILTCSKYCKTKAWIEFHKKDCNDIMAMRRALQFQMSQVFMKVQPEKYPEQNNQVSKSVQHRRNVESKNQVSKSAQLKGNPEQKKQGFTRRRTCLTA
ncbi:ankyrin repeat and MYND domain-containing protein 1 isoform X1 [Mus musculus]|uniref:ankyrin repeat and MYND domain-containing protein 1 isoform X1 n=2 Tax=Mus musculus TaxID=10090 RepID=UPI0003D744D8|nr:ankyrin repeat and MYND domain-containing protein 1 isoform X1 [Mus musculus]|eukprot:XP_006529653.1 PREDICTED: ankyrin repeat and MYND domain-containing protein 1 isoform X1 [Mus musculus]